MSDSGASVGPGSGESYRSVAKPFDILDVHERRSAWAVLRAVATATWVVMITLTGAWLLLCAVAERWVPVAGLPALGALAAALGLEAQVDSIRRGSNGKRVF